MKRGLYIAFGVAFLVIGVALAGLGTTIALSAGSDDALSTAPARVRGTGVAVVAEDFQVDTSSIPIPQDVGSLTLTVTARDGRQMFVGAAQSSDVDTYLTGAPYDVVVDLTAGEKATTRKVPGGQQPQKPGGQAFWSAQSSGAPASLTARLTPGTTLVVMNADASPEIDADVVVTLRVPRVWTYSWIVAGVGLLLVVLAAVLFWRARVAHRRRAAAASDVVGPAEGTGSTVLPATVLPASQEVAPAGPPPAETADSVVVAPQAPSDDIVAAPASAGIAALVAQASGEPDDATTEIPVVEQVPAAETDPEVEHAAAGEGDIAVDPVFEELVQAHGGDPVHDVIADVAPEVPGSSSAPSTDG